MKEKDDYTADTGALIFGEVIHAYSRKQAIEDGVLIAVDEEVRRGAGFRFPVAFTSAAWAPAVLKGPPRRKRMQVGNNQQTRRIASVVHTDEEHGTKKVQRLDQPRDVVNQALDP